MTLGGLKERNKGGGGGGGEREREAFPKMKIAACSPSQSMQPLNP